MALLDLLFSLLSLFEVLAYLAYGVYWLLHALVRGIWFVLRSFGELVVWTGRGAVRGLQRLFRGAKEPALPEARIHELGAPAPPRLLAEAQLFAPPPVPAVRPREPRLLAASATAAAAPLGEPLDARGPRR